VDVLELTSWPAGRETPTDCDSLLHLIHLVAERQQQQQQSTSPAAELALYDRRTSSVIVQCL